MDHKMGRGKGKPVAEGGLGRASKPLAMAEDGADLPALLWRDFYLCGASFDGASDESAV